MASSGGGSDRKRVKVYELRENDWFDRGTGFCTGQIINDNEPRIYVESEDHPDKMLLESRIVKDDSYQKQQDTLIVWTEPNGIDMALSFQEAEGCTAIWEFVHAVQQQLMQMAEDGLSEDGHDIAPNCTLTEPQLGNLDEVESNIRAASITSSSRESLARFLTTGDYMHKLARLVDDAEDLESLGDLHRLCNIMKALILMNDNSVIEHLVTDDLILGVVGALEYDPDFPTHKANHRQYLADESRFKEVVEIKDEHIRRKIRQTWRLQYLKDVVLARILDDPTFGVLNSLIFFHQVDIVQHLQSNGPFLKELFGIFTSEKEADKRKQQGVHFIQQCCAIAKTLQLQNRSTLLNNFISHGLFNVISYAVRHTNASQRTTGIEILVALLDHDPNMMRGYMLKAVHDKRVPLTDTLIDLLHVETDLGVKNQLADAIKILLDPMPPQQDVPGRTGNSEYMSKLSRPQLTPTQAANEQFAQDHFDKSCKKLFTPLKNLESRTDMKLSYQEVTLFNYLIEILTFFVRQHSMRSRPFVSSDALASRVAQILKCPQKTLELTALKFFRTCVSLQDQFYTNQVLKSDAFDAIISIVVETMPRDNLLNSACLELFEYISKEAIKPLINHLGQNFRLKLQSINTVETFSRILIKYDQQNNHDPDLILFSQDDDSTPINRRHMTTQWAALQEMDAEEEAYFATSDDDDLDESLSHISQPRTETTTGTWQKRRLRSEAVNGNDSKSRVGDPETPHDYKPLVDYPDDDDDENEGDATPRTPLTPGSDSSTESPRSTGQRLQPSPELREDLQTPERMAEKRRRTEGEDEDELDKLSTGIKRRNSASNVAGLVASANLRRKKGFLRSKIRSPDNPGPDHDVARKGRKIAITLTNKSEEPPPDQSSTESTTPPK